jgi:hypothetical protein
MAKDFITQGDGFADVALSRGVEIAGAKVQALRMREPTVGDQLAIDKIQGDAAKEMALFANLCELTPDDLKKLSLKDYRRLQQAFAGFID